MEKLLNFDDFYKNKNEFNSKNEIKEKKINESLLNKDWIFDESLKGYLKEIKEGYILAFDTFQVKEYSQKNRWKWTIFKGDMNNPMPLTDKQIKSGWSLTPTELEKI